MKHDFLLFVLLGFFSFPFFYEVAFSVSESIGTGKQSIGTWTFRVEHKCDERAVFETENANWISLKLLERINQFHEILWLDGQHPFWSGLSLDCEYLPWITVILNAFHLNIQLFSHTVYLNLLISYSKTAQIPLLSSLLNKPFSDFLDRS